MEDIRNRRRKKQKHTQRERADEREWIFIGIRFVHVFMAKLRKALSLVENRARVVHNFGFRFQASLCFLLSINFKAFTVNIFLAITRACNVPFASGAHFVLCCVAFVRFLFVTITASTFRPMLYFHLVEMNRRKYTKHKTSWNNYNGNNRKQLREKERQKKQTHTHTSNVKTLHFARKNSNVFSTRSGAFVFRVRRE